MIVEPDQSLPPGVTVLKVKLFSYDRSFMTRFSLQGEIEISRLQPKQFQRGQT